MGVIRWACQSCFACTFCSSGLNLSDPGAEDALYESAVLRRFAGVDLGLAAAPDETTILRFRRLLETHELCGQILDTVNLYLASKRLRISTGTIVDAGYQGQGKVIREAAPHAQDMTSRRGPSIHSMQGFYSLLP
jgi:transposase, IS5 family